MKFLELRNDCLLEITKFLNFDDLVRMKNVCKFFGLFLNRYKEVFNQRFSTHFGIQNEENLDLWIDIWKRIKDDQGSYEEMGNEKFVPYFTDGGTNKKSKKSFIDKLIINLDITTILFI